jgi:hypothetical protein
MKKTFIAIVSLMALPVYAQSLLGTLNKHQSSLQPPETEETSPSRTSRSSRDEAGPITDISSTSAGLCEADEQTSLPLAYITSLIQSQEGKLDIGFDPREGSLKISAPDMISNCSSMLEWKLRAQTLDGKNTYAVEVKLKKTICDADTGSCKYKIAMVEDGVFKEHKEMDFKPTLKGFEECLQKSGVVSEGKVNPKAIYSAPLMEKFKDVKQSGKLLFVSNGPSSALVKAKYGSFDTINKCDHYEAIHPEVKALLSLEDEERQRLDAEASKLKNCGINEYHKVADFIEKYEGYASVLGKVRDNLILEAAKKSAKAIQEGKYTDEDLKVIEDFSRYMVEPKIAEANALYAEMLELEGDAKKDKQTQLKGVLAEIATLSKSPYYLPAHTTKLVKDGKFEEAEKLHTMGLTISAHRRLGFKENNLIITPEVAMLRVAQGKASFEADLEIQKERYQIRTGQITGQSDLYNQLASRMRRNIEVRTENFHEEIRLEYARVQPGGYCYAYFRNLQKCSQDSVQRIQELQNLLNHYNKVDSERAAEYDAKAKDYGALEAEGRRYIAVQNGEDYEEEVPQEVATPVDTTVPTPRPNNGSNGVYTFDYNQPNRPQQQPSAPQQGYPQYFQQNPYQPQQQSFWGQQMQQPYMGQQAYGYGMQNGMGMNGGYSFNWGGQAQQQQPMYGQPQQQGYWGQPYSAYNMYSMYGR